MSDSLAPPFFTILIPTKNRSHILEGVLNSILEQSFKSYEVLVVDNDDTTKTLQLCQKINSPKIRHIRTGSLSMVDNWSYGIDYACGSWIIFLEDKQALYPESLHIINRVISKHSITTALVYDGDYFNDIQFPGIGKVVEKAYSGKVEWLCSENLLSRYEKNLVASEGRVDIGDYLPKPQHSAVNIEYIKETKKKFGEYFSFGALDFTSAITKLLLSKGVYRIDQGLYLVVTMKESNGLNAATYRENTHRDYFPLANKVYKDQLLSLPFPEISATNVFLVDYLVIRKIFDPKFLYDINMEDYFKCIYKDIFNIHSVVRGVKLSGSIKKWHGYLQESNLENKKKRRVLLFGIRWTIFIYLYKSALKLKHLIDRVIFSSNKAYLDPADYIKNKSLPFNITGKV